MDTEWKIWHIILPNLMTLTLTADAAASTITTSQSEVHSTPSSSHVDANDSAYNFRTTVSDNYTSVNIKQLSEGSSSLSISNITPTESTPSVSASYHGDVLSTEEVNSNMETESDDKEGGTFATTKTLPRKKNNHMLVGMSTGLGACVGAGIILCICWHCLCSRLYAQRQVAPTDLRIPTKPRLDLSEHSKDFR